MNSNRVSVMQLAMKDISEEIQNEFGQKVTRYTINGEHHFDVWNVSPKMILNSGASRLNRELGIHSVNKSGCKQIKGGGFKSDKKIKTGVYLHAATGKYTSNIIINGCNVSLGYHDTDAKAHAFKVIANKYRDRFNGNKKDFRRLISLKYRNETNRNDQAER